MHDLMIRYTYGVDTFAVAVGISRRRRAFPIPVGPRVVIVLSLV